MKNAASSFAKLGVCENRGTPKSSILIGFSIINYPFWGYPYFRKHPNRCWWLQWFFEFIVLCFPGERDPKKDLLAFFSTGVEA